MKELEYISKLAYSIKIVENEFKFNLDHVDALKEKIKQYEEITEIRSETLPRYGQSLEKFKK